MKDSINIRKDFNKKYDNILNKLDKLMYYDNRISREEQYLITRYLLNKLDPKILDFDINIEKKNNDYKSVC